MTGGLIGSGHLCPDVCKTDTVRPPKKVTLYKLEEKPPGSLCNTLISELRQSSECRPLLILPLTCLLLEIRLYLQAAIAQHTGGVPWKMASAMTLLPTL